MTHDGLTDPDMAACLQAYCLLARRDQPWGTTTARVAAVLARIAHDLGGGMGEIWLGLVRDAALAAHRGVDDADHDD